MCWAHQRLATARSRTDSPLAPRDNDTTKGLPTCYGGSSGRFLLRPSTSGYPTALTTSGESICKLLYDTFLNEKKPP